MLRILLSAYACEPNRGSEAEIGWSLAHELAKTHKVWVITRANSAAVHQEAFWRHGRPENLTIVYFDTPAWMRWFKRGKRNFLLYYYLWQVLSARTARRIVAAERIDVVHHVTGGMDWMPSGLAFTRRPFVWGPIGSERTHLALYPLLTWRERLHDRIRRCALWCLRSWDPMVRYTSHRASIILSHTKDNLAVTSQKRVRPWVQTGIREVPELAKPKRDMGRRGPMKLVYAGELVAWKGARFAVSAFLRAAAHRNDMRLIVVGEGPLAQELKNMSSASGVANSVNFTGKLPLSRLVQVLAEGDAFIYPSYHHGLATVVLQAMLTGLPVICIEGDATGRTVGSECGITVPLVKPDSIVDGLASAISLLADDEVLRLQLATQAQRVARTRYSYQAIAEGYAEVYREAQYLAARVPR